MARIERSIEIERSPEEVFAALTDLDRLPRWATILVESRHTPGEAIREGQTFEQTVRLAGINVESRWRVERLDPPREVAYHAESDAGGRLDMIQRVLPSGEASRVELEIDYDLPGGLLGEALDRIYVEARNQREAEHSLQNLKDLLEGGSVDG